MGSHRVSLNGIQTADSQNPVRDFSGVECTAETTLLPNPYDALLLTVRDQSRTPFEHDDITLLTRQGPQAGIRKAYEDHRVNRNALKKQEMLAADFGIIKDPILSELVNPQNPNFVDPRNSLVFWARPPPHILNLAVYIQDELNEIMPAIWLMPSSRMHITVLEVLYSVPMQEVMEVAHKLAPIVQTLINLPTTTHGCTLYRPQISFDAAGISLSFVPYCADPIKEFAEDPESLPDAPPPVATGSWGSFYTPKDRADIQKFTRGSSTPASSGLASAPFSAGKRLSLGDITIPTPSSFADAIALPDLSEPTYHHLRRELFQRISDHGVPINSRYKVPSAHITLCRFLNCGPGAWHNSAEFSRRNVRRLLERIEEINQELESGSLEHWSGEDWELRNQLVCRVGTLWYGGGFTFSDPGEGRKWVEVDGGREWAIRVVCDGVDCFSDTCACDSSRARRGRA